MITAIRVFALAFPATAVVFCVYAVTVAVASNSERIIALSIAGLLCGLVALTLGIVAFYFLGCYEKEQRL